MNQAKSHAFVKFRMQHVMYQFNTSEHENIENVVLKDLNMFQTVIVYFTILRKVIL